MTEYIKSFNLQLFADGAGGGDGGAAAGDATGEAVQAVAAPVYELPATRRRPGLPRQAATPAPQPAQPVAVQQDAPAAPEPVDARKPFDELVKGEYKQDFDTRVQEIVKNRLKTAKGAEEKLGKYQSALQILGERYGIDAADPDALSKALEGDKSLYEDEAMKQGMTTEQYMQQKALERQVETYRVQQQREAQQQKDAQEMQSLTQQAAELKATHPEFDLQQAMTTLPELARMVLKPPRGSGIPLKAAYIALNFDKEQSRWQEQTQQAVQQTAQTAQAHAAQAVASGARRPVENGSSGGAAASTKTGVPPNMTLEQIREYARRAQKGEQITFK